MGGATLQLYYSYKPLIHDVDISKNEKQTAFPIKTFHDRIELRPKTTNNKRMQTVLKEVVKVGINYRVAPRSTQPFILPRLINWVPGTPGNWMVKSKLSPRSGSVALSLRQLNPIHKRDHKAFFIYIYRHLVSCFCLVFVCSEYCLMQDLFLPKTSFFKSQSVYLASYLLYCISQNIENSEWFFLLPFALELWKGGRVAKIFTPIATSSI